jgi:dienelactone hydrolase
MDIVSEDVDKGVIERRFDLKVGSEVVPGIHWLPERADGPHGTILIGHGGTTHKRVDYVLSLARQLVRHLGVGCVALDAPDHGDRVTNPEAAAKARAALGRRIAGGGAGGAALDADTIRAMAERAVVHVAEWRALIDDLATNERWAAGPFGWWGVSMGTTHGIPLIASEPRITAAVLGLNGLRPGSAQEKQARAITIPVLYLHQWEDELMSRESALALWDALGSKEKTLHINPGGHVGVPQHERQAAEAFFRRHLLAG